MADLELYSVILQQGDYCESFIESFTTLLFAFLIASYLVADKLDRVMVAIVISLYSAMALRYAFLYHNTSGDIVAIAAELRDLAAMPESNVSWVEIGPVGVFYPSVTVILVLSYLASLVFFFHTRRKPRRGGGESSLLGNA